MIRSLWTAASGMTAQQFNIDVISNNLSNVNTTGFKKSRADFEDLIYQQLRVAGSPSSIKTMYPTGLQVGLGVKPAATHKFYTQGSPMNTEQKTDIAIMGDGFFKIRMKDGSESYTRDGSFKIDSNGDLVTSNGNYLVEPQVSMPDDYIPNSITITQDGLITVRTAREPNEDSPIGQLTLYRFVNPKGLKNIGKNLVVETVASGPAYEGLPDREGYGQTLQGFLEMSNVAMVDEMVSMIVAQRAYEMNSKAIQTSDSLLATAVALKR